VSNGPPCGRALGPKGVPGLGVIRPTTTSFEIVHYQLSIAVPNEVIPQVTGTIKAFETK